jgi:hypothetical protein
VVHRIKRPAVSYGNILDANNLFVDTSIVSAACAFFVSRCCGMN